MLDYTLATMSVLTPQEGLATGVAQKAPPNLDFAQDMEVDVWKSGTELGRKKLATQDVEMAVEGSAVST